MGDAHYIRHLYKEKRECNRKKKGMLQRRDLREDGIVVCTTSGTNRFDVRFAVNCEC